MIRTITILLLTIVFSYTSQAQFTIQYGDNLINEIVEVGEVHNYTFTAEAGDIIWIRMRDIEEVDAHFRLFNDEDSLIAEDFDIGGLANFSDILLEKAGTYLIQAFDHVKHAPLTYGNDVGRYGISLQKLNTPGYGTWLPHFVNFDDSIRATTAVNVFNFNGEEGDLMFAQMRALTSHLECEFFLYSYDGEMLMQSKRSGRLAQTQLSLPYTGSYHLYITDKGGNDADLFGFSLQMLNRLDGYPSISCGQSEQGYLSTLAARYPYRLDMQEGDQGILQMRSPNGSIEMSFEVYDESGNLLVDETGSDKMVGVELSAQEDRTYLVIVEDKHGNDFGPYGMHFELVTGQLCAEEILCETQNAFEHSLEVPAQLKSYQIYGIEGEPYAFDLREVDKELEPYLRLYDAAGNMLQEKHGSIKVNIEDQFPHTGQFLLLIGDRSGNDLGNYTLISNGSTGEIYMPDTVTIEPGQECVEIICESNAKVASYEWNNGEQSPTIKYCGPEGLVTVQVVFENGCTGSGETFVAIKDQPCQMIDFNGFVAGAIPGDQLGMVMISAANKKGPGVATIFPSGDPPKHSEDLGTPNADFGGPGKGKGGKKDNEGANSTAQEKVLIIAENVVDRDGDGILDMPDDNTGGGTLIFDFPEAIHLRSLKVIDIENEGSKIELYGGSKKLKTIPLGPLGDNSVQTIDIDVSGVSKMEVRLKGSGAIDDIVYCTSYDLAPFTRNHRQNSSSGPNASAEVDAERGAEELIVQGSANNTLHSEEDAIVYPNPTADLFHVGLGPTFESPVELSIFNMTGSLVYQKQKINPIVQQILSIDDFNFPSGIYLLELKSQTHQQTLRLLKR
ncbi:MAG: T9SS type A sorting domain-containing protein [Saprospiraceae bacterium]|nr:T9SS type A sorting domain-containing protein [Saprospiraceae bacterium]